MSRHAIGAVALGCAVLMAGCTSTPAPPPQTEVKTVTVAPTSSAAESSPVPTAPGRVFDSAAMQADIAKILTGTYKLKDVGAVTCPPKQAVQDGTTFTCVVPVDGTQKRVPITVTGEDGQYRVGAPT